MNKKVTRLYTGTDGESHFEDIEIPLVTKDGKRWQSELVKTQGIIFSGLDVNCDLGWINAPRRQYVIRLEDIAPYVMSRFNLT